MKNTLCKHQIGHQSTLLSADSLYKKQQSAVREADQRLPTGFSAACYAAQIRRHFEDRNRGPTINPEADPYNEDLPF